MIYLNGQIGAVYMDGRYHSEVYLGSVLVWSAAIKVPGEAAAQIGFLNTAQGVAAVLLPGMVAGLIGFSSDVTAQANGAADGSAGELLTLLTAAESTAAGTSNGAALENLLLQYTALGKGIIVNKRQIEEQLKLTTPVPLAVALDLVPTGTVSDELTMETTIPPAVAATLVDDEASLALQLVQTASAGDAVLFADGLLDGMEQITALAEGGAGDGAEGAATSELTVGSVIQPETLTMTDGQIAGHLVVKTQVKSGTVDAMAAMLSPKIELVSQVSGKAVGWIDPVQYGGLLVVKQVYSATVKQDGVLGNILEVT